MTLGALAIRIGQLLSLAEQRKSPAPAECITVLLAAAAATQLAQREPGVSVSRARELFIAESARLFDAAQAQSGEPAPLIQLVDGG